MAHQQFAKLLHIWALWGPGHSDDLDLVVTQISQEVNIARVVHQHAVTRLQQGVDHHVERLAGPLGKHDLFAVNRHSSLGQVTLQPLPEGMVAAGLAILGNQARAATKATQCQAQPRLIEPGIGQTAAPRLQDTGIRIEGIIQKPIDILQRCRTALLLDAR